MSIQPYSIVTIVNHDTLAGYHKLLGPGNPAEVFHFTQGNFAQENESFVNCENYANYLNSVAAQ